LHFDLHDEETFVHSKLQVQRVESSDSTVPLVLNGEDLELRSVLVDGKSPAAADLIVDENGLTLLNMPPSFELETTVRLKPHENTQLSGLYRSNGVFCTQNEAEGFRRITYFPDRPDVLSKYKVYVEGPQAACPIMLSNGNMIESGELGGGRHYSRWEDPWNKPSYLFALVAGDLGVLRDRFTTMNGRDVALAIYSEHQNVDKLEWAMQSLKRSFEWDEQKFGLEYDLDIYNIVAVDDFNMGAMENKSLNVFNSAAVLASPQTATDADFEYVEAVIAHEYFHNWTGNRVTCRDWFQLTLKEGLTVFRDQSFTADQTSPAVKRISDVQMLRAFQFKEDAGPMAHPIRPESVIAQDNFYTATVYNKGAEVVRMFQTILGVSGFRKGLDLYIKRHDGGAVTCDDFRAAMADANGVDLVQFEQWYLQPGTPVVRVSSSYDPSERAVTITLEQQPSAAAVQQSSSTPPPMHIPVSVGLLDANGADMLDGLVYSAGTAVLELKKPVQQFVFPEIDEEPAALSVLREFSAPVRLIRTDLKEGSAASMESSAFLMAHDSDAFSRWEAAQQLGMQVLMKAYKDLAHADGTTSSTSCAAVVHLPKVLIDSWRQVLCSADITDESLRAFALELPAERMVEEEMVQATLSTGVGANLDPIRIHAAREGCVSALAAECEGELRAMYDRLTADALGEQYLPEPQQVGRRRMRNLCLRMLSSIHREAGDDGAMAALCLEHFRKSVCMTDRVAALSCLCSSASETEREAALGEFERDYEDEPLAMNKWFGLQAQSTLPGTLERVQQLVEHPLFNMGNPNRMRALVMTFVSANAQFHRADGAGYAFLGDVVMSLDDSNPQIAARSVRALMDYRRYDEQRQRLMRGQLQRIVEKEGLSTDTYEIVSKSMQQQ
jgi:aminopeptidase N